MTMLAETQAEKAAVDEKISTLSAYRNSAEYMQLDEATRSAVTEQHIALVAYGGAVDILLEHLQKPAATIQFEAG